jgi:hypothetical protein
VVHFWDLEAKKPLFNKTYRSDQTVHRLEFSPEGHCSVEVRVLCWATAKRFFTLPFLVFLGFEKLPTNC